MTNPIQPPVVCSAWARASAEGWSQPRLEEGALPCGSLTYLMVTHILVSLSDKGTLLARGFCPSIRVLPDGRGWKSCGLLCGWAGPDPRPFPGVRGSWPRLPCRAYGESAPGVARIKHSKHPRAPVLSSLMAALPNITP